MTSEAQQKKRYLTPRAITIEPSGPAGDRVNAMIDSQIDKLRSAVREHPNHADLHYRLGVLKRSADDLHGAIESLETATRINPDYLHALTKLGTAYYDAGRPDDALEVFKRALAVDAESTELHYQLGLIFADRSQFELALRRFEFAAEQAPQNLDYLANLALSLQNMGLLDRAAATWRALRDVARQAEPTGHPTSLLEDMPHSIEDD